ncbi:MAG: MauE/DoxX family redox-associated membrane protein [Bacteroidota bacterium]
MDTTAGSQSKNLSFYLKRGIGLILLIALSFTFIYSAYTKSGIRFEGLRLMANDNAFDSFQWSFLDLGISSLLAAGIFARVMIGLELLLGLFLLFHIYLRSFTYKAVIGVLVIFIIYLLLVIARQGNSGNCGCFGDSIAMKPLTAIWKNLIMIAVTVVLMFIYPVRPYKHQEYVSLVIGLVSFTTPFVINNIYTGSAPERYPNSIRLDLLYKFDQKPAIDLSKGKHILAFMSFTCPHCRKAAYLLQIIHRQHPELPIYMVLDGPEEYRKEFFAETHAEHVPLVYYHHTAEFDTLVRAGYKSTETPGVPAIYWINNGKLEYKSKYAYYQLDPKYMKQWISSDAPLQ